ncbi:MAG: TIGR00366 family protein [Peptostreptococcaceae bacterium]|nr:TIGR00366 family protein [Peptostreptococcaceae bacterium]
MENLNKPKRKFKSPNAFIILISITIICTIMTWIIPAGEFQKETVESLGREVIIPGSYTQIASTPVTPWGMVQSIYDGFVEAADIIFFVLMAAAYVHVLMETGALNALAGFLLRILGKRDFLIISVFMFLFGLAGTTFGMYEETYGLIPAFMVIGITLSYDKIVGGAIVFIGVSTGFAAAILNPFTIGIASNIAGIPLMGGKITIVRIISFILFEILSIGYVMYYAHKIKKDPTKSVLYGETHTDLENLKSRDEVLELPFTKEQKISILGFGLLIVCISVGIIKFGFYLKELAALFLIFMVATCLINKMTLNETAEHFVKGCRNALYGTLLIGVARSISVVMTQGNITATTVNAMANLISALPKNISGIGMLLIQNLINFFIPSGSGQAVVMMPIMAPLADLVGLSREVSVIAFQFGDGFSNMFWPTGVAIECGIMGIGMDRWYKFITPLFLMMFGLQCLIIIASIALGV